MFKGLSSLLFLSYTFFTLLLGLGQDPGERNNLYNQHPEIVREFQDKLAEYRKTGRSVPSR